MVGQVFVAPAVAVLLAGCTLRQEPPTLSLPEAVAIENVAVRDEALDAEVLWNGVHDDVQAETSRSEFLECVHARADRTGPATRASAVDELEPSLIGVATYGGEVLRTTSWFETGSRTPSPIASMTEASSSSMFEPKRHKTRRSRRSCRRRTLMIHTGLIRALPLTGAVAEARAALSWEPCPRTPASSVAKRSGSAADDGDDLCRSRSGTVDGAHRRSRAGPCRGRRTRRRQPGRRRIPVDGRRGQRRRWRSSPTSRRRRHRASEPLR